MRQLDASIRHHDHQVSQAQFETRVPANTQDDDLSVEMSSHDGVWRGLPRRDNGGYFNKLFLWEQGYNGRSEPQPDILLWFLDDWMPRDRWFLSEVGRTRFSTTRGRC